MASLTIALDEHWTSSPLCAIPSPATGRRGEYSPASLFPSSSVSLAAPHRCVTQRAWRVANSYTVCAPKCLGFLSPLPLTSRRCLALAAHAASALRPWYLSHAGSARTATACTHTAMRSCGKRTPQMLFGSCTRVISCPCVSPTTHCVLLAHYTLRRLVH